MAVQERRLSFWQCAEFNQARIGTGSTAAVVRVLVGNGGVGQNGQEERCSLGKRNAHHRLFQLVSFVFVFFARAIVLQATTTHPTNKISVGEQAHELG